MWSKWNGNQSTPSQLENKAVVLYFHKFLGYVWRSNNENMKYVQTNLNIAITNDYI